jgi:hypothetical protein
MLEATFVNEFKSQVCKDENLFNITALGTEYDYRNGRVDIIARTKEGKLVAFEAKIERWRNALNQAYRSSSFAHYSYVLIPKSKSKEAIAQSREFQIRGVGLCTFGKEGIRIEIEASNKEPLQPWLTINALEHTSQV